MSSLKNLADKVANGTLDGVRVWMRHDGEIVVTEREHGTGEGDRWSGSVGAWQAALLAALSAKFVEGTLVVSVPESVSWLEAEKLANDLEERLPERDIVVIRDHWEVLSDDEREELRRALNDKPHYTRLTDWVRAQPSGASLLAVFSTEETDPAIETGANDGKLLGRIKEHELVKTLARREWSAVWLSKHVVPNLEDLVPRGVKVYRERES